MATEVARALSNSNKKREMMKLTRLAVVAERYISCVININIKPVYVIVTIFSLKLSARTYIGCEILPVAIAAANHRYC